MKIAFPTRFRWGRFAAVGQFALLAAITVAAADRPHFDSHSRDGAITIDGKFDDWSGNLEPFGSDPLSIQILNDGDFAYVRLSASDVGVRTQILRRGLTLWLDAKGGTKKVLGIHYPVVEQGSPDSAGRGSGRSGRARPPQGGDTSSEPASEPPSDASDAPSDRVDILGPGKNDAHSFMRDHLQGIEVALTVDQGVLQYELKVPLAATADRPYAIGTQPGKTIGLGLETAKPQSSYSGNRGGGGGMGGRGGGGMGRGGGGMGRGGGGMGRGGGGGDRSYQPPKPLKGWATVTLK